MKRRTLLTPLALLVLLFLSLSFAQRIVIEPQGIVVNPLPDPSFNIQVFLDRDPSGDARPTYNIGDSVRIGVTTNQSAYIYLYDVKSNGQITQILPNRFDDFGRNNFVQAGQTKFFPPEGARYTFTIDPPDGLSKVIAVASRTPLNTDPLATFNGSDPLATSNIGEGGFAEAFGIVVRPIQQQEWVTDTALYYVGQRPSTPAFGTLSIDSNPRGAEVLVDGRFAGFTPVQLGVRSGDHTIEMRLDGYVTFVTGTTVAGGETRNLRIDLDRVAAAPTPRPQPGGVVLFDDPYLIGLPGARILSLEIKNSKREVGFSITGGLDATYQHFHDQLQNLGWRRSELSQRDDRVSARYLLGGQRLDVDLRLRSDRYQLDLHFKGGDDDDG